MEKTRIIDFIKRIRRKIVKRDLLKGLFNGFLTGICGFFSIMALSLCVPIYNAHLYGFAILGITVLIFALVILLRMPSLKKTAAEGDRCGNFRERLSTALENLNADDDMSLIQRRDTLRRIQDADISKCFLWKPKTSRIVTAFAIMFLTAACAFIDTPAKDNAIYNHEVEEMAEETAKKEEEKIDRLSAIPELTPEELSKLEELYRETLSELKRSKTKADVQKAKDRFDRKSLNELSSFANGLSAEQKEAMIRSLEEMAQSTETTDSSLANDLSQLASNLKSSGDLASATEINPGGTA
ncbi:MAG: hypothetical protein IJS80_04235, partial [Lachnospiraceae bacterium]|nr:hypothetical protein [Lachnospiraceae bacterium]